MVTLANSKIGDKPQDERLPRSLDDIFTTMEERFARLSIQLSEESADIKQRIPAAVGQAKSNPPSPQWVITGTQARLMSDRMAFYAPQNPTDIITSLIGDADSYTFASSLAKAFRTAGWKLSQPSGFSQALITGRPIKGVLVQIHSKETVPAALKEFIAISKETGVTPTAQISQSVPRGEFRIIVGSKSEANSPQP